MDQAIVHQMNESHSGGWGELNQVTLNLVFAPNAPQATKRKKETKQISKITYQSLSSKEDRLATEITLGILGPEQVSISKFP